MKVEGRRTSTNVEDRRKGKAAAKAGGIGGGAAVIAIIIYLLTGQQVDPAAFSSSKANEQTCKLGEACSVTNTAIDPNYANGEFKNEDDLGRFASQILASTEDVWSDVFKKNGMTYVVPKMVLFSDAVDTGCGKADSNVGPFYCSADKSLYIDLSFLANMKKQLGAGGGFAYAYVIAHEVGHHVQNIRGDLPKYGLKEQQLRKQNQNDQANFISVQMELQADYYAGVWAHHESKTYGSIDQADIKNAMNAAVAVGDDTLGVKRKENFSHGSSEMRVKWLYKGLKSGELNGGNTYEYPSLQALEAIEVK